tara:strand:- start:1350 stop:1580 length:231 start_codon:yes stop_codon:yes gene_type:complete
MMAVEVRDHLYFHMVKEWAEDKLLPLVEIHLIRLLRKIHSVILFRHFRELLMGRVALGHFPVSQYKEVDNGWKLVG